MRRPAVELDDYPLVRPKAIGLEEAPSALPIPASVDIAPGGPGGKACR
jgi:hypothetical protein